MAETETKKRTGLGALADADDADDFSVIDAIGGPRGVVESMLPGVVFVVMFVITSDLHLTIGVSAALAVLQVRNWFSFPCIRGQNSSCRRACR